MEKKAHEVALACKGFLDDEEGLLLHDLARDHVHLGPVVEIGSYCGKSSVYIGSGVRESGGTIVCVDHHRGSEEQQPGEEYHDADLFDADVGCMDSLRQLRHTIHNAGLEEVTALLVSSSKGAASLWNKPIGMLFIDGGHSHEAAHADFESWSGFIAPGGILAIHDLFPDPAEGGQAPIEVYRHACATGDYEELPTTKTLGVLRRLCRND